MEDKFIITGVNRVVMVGKYEYPEKTTSFTHELPDNELIFNFSGHSTVCFNDQILENMPNSIRFLPKGKPKRYDVIRHEPGECIDIFFQADREISPEAFIINIHQDEKIGTLFKRIFTAWVSKKDGYYFEVISLLYRIFSEMQRDSSVPKQHSDRIAPALEMIHGDFLNRDFSIHELAAVCNIGESYFQKLFREKYGVSPKRYIIRLKVNHACDLLRLERYTVTQVAEICNFADVYFFSRQFKEYTGLSPTQFAKMYKSSK